MDALDGYRIGAVARLTGLSTHVIRVWERRYGALEPIRTDGGERRYSQVDVDRLRLIRELADDGHPLRGIASLSLARLKRMARSAERDAAGDSEDAFHEQLDQAVATLNVTRLDLVLREAADRFGLSRLITSLIPDALTRIGARWAEGELTPAHEHAASAVFISFAGGVLREHRNPDSGSVTVATTLAGDRHELGALLAAALAAVRGHRALYLGADLPADDIVGAVKQSRASTVLVSIVDLNSAEAGADLRKVVAGLPSHVAVYVGGRAASSVRLGSNTRVKRFESLAQLDPFLPVAD